MAQDPFDDVHRDAPDPEEAQDMVNPESIEVVSHVLEPPFPPAIPVFAHLVPVVGWKTPVLAFDREIVRRRARLLVHVVKAGLHPGVAAIAINADGDIPFHHHTVLMGIVDRVPELEMQVVLDKILKEDRVVMRSCPGLCTPG